MTDARRILQKWVEGIELTHDPRYFHSIKVLRRAIRAGEADFPRLEKQAWAAIEQALEYHPGVRKRARAANQVVPTKLRVIFEVPSGSPYGTRPENVFVKLPRRTVMILMETADAMGSTLEEYVRGILEQACEEIVTSRGRCLHSASEGEGSLV